MKRRGDFTSLHRGQVFTPGEAWRRRIQAGYRQKLRKRRQGLCWACTAKAVAGKSHCQPCLDRKRERNRQQRGWGERTEPKKLKGRRMYRRLDALVPHEIYDQLAAIADQEDLFVTDVVRGIIQDYLEELAEG